VATSSSGKVIGAPSDLDPCPVDEKLVCRFSIVVIIDLLHIPRLGSWIGTPDARHDTVINSRRRNDGMVRDLKIA
jgi:hypothetical protein